ncbi:uncharacterized protein LOC143286022 isoform X1 [Babylonia areolata]|uniref:uncharacterized protein LOC143286022 isoform X1 n=1 Tax=Babylonia areolata TaxID=304850 RepID=UPI003FD017A9
MNPDFQKIGESFVSYYYNIFDQRETRENILACYHAEALLTFEEEQCQGIQTIRQKLCEKFKMGSIHRVITKIDCQPMYDGGVLVYVFGQLVCYWELAGLGKGNLLKRRRRVWTNQWASHTRLFSGALGTGRSALQTRSFG